MNKKTNHRRVITLGSLGLLVVVLGIGGWYGYRAAMRSQGLAAAAAAVKNAKTTTPSAHQSTFKIAELNIGLSVPDSISDLTYSIKSTKSSDGKPILSAYLSTASLTALDAACGNGGLGVISKVDGQYPQDSKTISAQAGTLAKQFPAFYVSYLMPQSYCSKNQTAILLFRNQYTALASELDSISELK